MSWYLHLTRTLDGSVVDPHYTDWTGLNYTEAKARDLVKRMNLLSGAIHCELRHDDSRTVTALHFEEETQRTIEQRELARLAKTYKPVLFVDASKYMKPKQI